MTKHWRNASLVLVVIIHEQMTVWRWEGRTYLAGAGAGDTFLTGAKFSLFSTGLVRGLRFKRGLSAEEGLLSEKTKTFYD